jgi:CRISPR system Cascade subunit CasE
MSTQIHLVKLGIDAQKLYAFARRSRAAGGRDFDEGYGVHALFAALFDHGAPVESRVAPKPFSVAGAATRSLSVLAYTELDHHALVERAKTFGDPDAYGVTDLEAMASKPMPTTFEAGARLGFSVRVCPVRRVAKRGNQRKDRAEVDAFLAQSWEMNDESKPLDREQVYRDWLASELQKEGAATLLSSTMTGFQLGGMNRRTQGDDRRARRLGHPDATFDGVLQVKDGDAFVRRLARGIGRHRSFGFGMLLLRPPPRT